MELRGYQQKLVNSAYGEWDAGAQNVLMVLATGGGKTVTFTDVMKRDRFPIAIAHRSELVGQMAVTLGRQGIQHRIIAPDSTIREIVKLQMHELGRSFYDPNAPTACAGVDTLINKSYDWFSRVDRWVIDEAHHLLRENKWGKAASLFPNARGLGVTATPVRADGKGLGRHAHGLFDTMIEGPCGEDLIQMGSLCPYKIMCPKPSINRDLIATSASGDFSPKQLRQASRASKIVGDVVQTYLTHARGALSVVFATCVEDAQDFARSFMAQGIPAQVVTAKTGTLERALILRKFRERKILVLINVDLFGEGFDLPALEVVIMARPTESYALFAQQFGRVLRPMPGKEYGLVIDHVGNVIRHKLPTTRKQFTLDAREARSGSHPSDGDRDMRACTSCTAPYERILVACPYCGEEHVPSERSGPEHVDGDLILLEGAALQALIEESTKIDRPAAIPFGASPAVAGRLQRVHRERAEAQRELRALIALWGGYRTQEGLDVRESQRLFYLTFGIDVLSAQGLNARDAEKLKIKVSNRIFG